MKVLVVSPKFHPIIGGGETFVLNSVKRLHQSGVGVAIAVEPNVKRRLDEYPFKVHELPGLSDSHMDITTATANLFKLLQDIQPDIIHVHGYFPLLITGFCNIGNIPVLASIHSTPVWGERIVGGMDSFDVELNFARETLAVGKPRIVTAANRVYADAAEKVVQGKFKVVVLPYPVDADFFCKQTNPGLRSAFGLKDSDRFIMVPSRIIERKGIKEAVLALGELPDNFYLCLPGAVEPLDKEYWESIEAHPVYKKIQNRVIVPKQKLLYDDMPGLYGASDIIAMPSYYEGAPVATVEAMASEKPFVGADSQGINSFIRTEENGLLVPQKSASELAQAILRLAEDQVLGAKFAAQARKDIMRLAWGAQLPHLIEMYKSLVVSTLKTKPVAEAVEV